MKKTLGLLIMLVAVALVFTGCGEKATVFKATDDGITSILTFNSDGTWNQSLSGSSNNITVNLISLAGVYTGNPKANGTLTVTLTKQINQSTYLGVVFAAAYSGQTSLTITNENVPLEPIPASQQQTTTMTISGGTITDSNGHVYTRQ